jgi:hypothetical protein
VVWLDITCRYSACRHRSCHAYSALDGGFRAKEDAIDIL